MPTARDLPWASSPGWPGPVGRAGPPKKKKPAPADPSRPRAKKEPSFNSPYTVFCREQRPLLPPNLSGLDREKCLGELAL